MWTVEGAMKREGTERRFQTPQSQMSALLTREDHRESRLRWRGHGKLTWCLHWGDGLEMPPF